MFPSSKSGREPAKPSTAWWLIPCLLAVLAGCESPAARAPATVASDTAAPAPSAERARAPLTDTKQFGLQVESAFQSRRSHVWVEDAGTVVRLLRDDTKRPRHQRFVVDAGGGVTVLIAHNIDLAPRVPIKPGDKIDFRGEYIWSAQGGTVHWTHRDPEGGKNSGGYIRWKGQNYR